MNRVTTARVRYDRRKLESAVMAGIRVANAPGWNAPVYVFATAYGYAVCPRRPATGQAYYAIEPRRNPELVPARVDVAK